ncbi:phytochelatin synthase family protein [bacterium]|nr:phytochelatin synthase family protein [bacterium]
MNLRRLFFLLAFCLVGQAWAQRLPLPATSIGLDSPAGQKLLLESDTKADYWPLSIQYQTQQDPSSCGPASSVMILNALALPSPVSKIHQPFHQFDQDNFFSPAAEKVLSRTTLRRQGATLNELAGMLSSWGAEVQVCHARQGGLEEFRDQARQALGSGQRFVIINFHRDPLGQSGGSHFSPLAAYHQGSDRFLVMDVARFRYPPFWVKADPLFRAMNTVDGVSEQTRGYLLITAPHQS